MKTFAEYKSDAPNWITMAGGEFYPDILTDACELYKPVLVLFGQLLKSSESSERLLKQITDVKVNGSSVVTNKVANISIDLSGKQDVLSETQMQAVNSGIDTTKVAQIETNKNNITSLQGIVNTNTTNISNLTTQLGGYTISVVTALPSTPSANTIYFVKE